jgi:hypothetical protein
MSFSLETVKTYFKDNGCELLETEYINSSTKMKYKCKCEQIYYITFKYFKRIKGCRKCQCTPRITFEFAQKYFIEQNCKLLETTFIDSKTKMRYICKCKNESTINWNHFQQGKRCRKCCGSEKLTFEFVQKAFLEQECELLETEYKNIITKMKYRCNCGNISTISFSDFQNGHKCRKCSGTEKLTFEFVKTYFEKEGCELLETQYFMNNVKMRYICTCKKESMIDFQHFRQGVRCKECGIEKQQKVSKHFKDYTFPSEKLIRIQGYENLALDELVKRYSEEDILTDRNDMPKIMYEFKGKTLRYYPDIYIKSENKIIEVKSTYTYKVTLIKNMIKSLSTRKLKYDFEFWVYKDEKKNTFSKFII